MSASTRPPSLPVPPTAIQLVMRAGALARRVSNRLPVPLGQPALPQEAANWPPAEQVVAAGRRVALRVLGEAAAGTPPVLVVHDRPGNAAACAPLVTALAARRRVLAPDLPGCGESEERGPYEPAALAEVLAVLAMAEVEGSVRQDGDEIDDDPADTVPGGVVDVVGHGSGGVVALALAAGWPELVRRLVLIATPDDWRGQLPRVERCLLLYGSADVTLSPRTAPQLMRRLQQEVDPSSVRLASVPGAGHAPFLDVPADIADLVGDALA